MKLFGYEIIKAKKPDDMAKEAPRTLYQQVQGFGMRLTAYDYIKDAATLTTIAKYNPWIASCIRAITRNSIQPVGRLWDPKSEKDIENPEILKLLRQPHPDFTEARFRKYLTFYHEFYGIAYIYKVRMESGKLVALQPLPSDRVQLNPTLMAQGVVAFQFMNGGQPIDLKNEDLIVWADDEFIDNYYTGGSKLSHLLFAAANKNNADRFNKATIENGGEVKGVLYTEQRIGPEDVKVYQQQLKERYGGPENAGKNMILGSGLKYEKTGQSISEMGFDKLQTVSREEVLGVYKVPPVELGLTDSVNYSNAQAQRKLFWETNLIPLFDSYASVITLGIVQAEYKSELEYYFDYSAIAAMQTELSARISTGMQMQLMGYDNKTITSTLDLPELAETEQVEPAQKTIVIPNRFKSAFRDSSKELFGKSHQMIELQFRKTLEKYFLGWRNDILDFIKDDGRKDESSPKERLIKYLSGRLEIANGDIKKIASVMFSKIDDQIVKRMLDKYGLKWVEGTQNIIVNGSHMNNIVLVNKTVDQQLQDMIREAYTNGLANNYGTAEMADAFVSATKDVYKLADKRAITIARTETTSLANDLMLGQYKENDIEKKEWMTAQDGDVRSFEDGATFDHSAVDGIQVGVEDLFRIPSVGGSEGLQYPGDQANGSAGNVVNCRCTMMPV